MGGMGKINFNTIAALFFILFSIVAFFLIPSQIEQPKLFMGLELMPLKPHWFPEVVILGLLGLSVWYFFQSFHLREENLFRKLEKRGYIRILLTLGACVAYATWFETLGFVASSVVVVLTLSIYYGNRNIFSLIAMIFIIVIVFFAFTKGLHVSLPELPSFS
jgi:hypothetical protein